MCQLCKLGLSIMLSHAEKTIQKEGKVQPEMHFQNPKCRQKYRQNETSYDIILRILYWCQNWGFWKCIWVDLSGCEGLRILYYGDPMTSILGLLSTVSQTAGSAPRLLKRIYGRRGAKQQPMPRQWEINRLQRTVAVSNEKARHRTQGIV